MIGKALLPASSDKKTLPAPAATTSTLAATETPAATTPVAETPPAPAEKTDIVFNFDSSAETKTEVKEEIPDTATSTPVQVNATPSTPRPLSPYPYVSEFSTLFYIFNLETEKYDQLLKILNNFFKLIQFI